MLVRPGDVIGLPDLSAHVALFRWLVVALSVAAAVSLVRGKNVQAVMAAVAYSILAVGFWVLALGRPYGVLVEPKLTMQAADRAVAAASGNAAESFLAGEPRTPGVAGRLAARLPASLLLLAPAWLPVLVLPLSALALSRLAAEHAVPAALLWLAFSTGDLDTLRGAGFVPGLWARPGAALAFLALLGLLAVLRRRLATRGAGLVAALIVAAVWWLLGFRSAPIGQTGTLWLLTLDQGLWLPLAAWGFWRVPRVPAMTLAAAGAALALLNIDIWGAHAFYRAGLILSAIPAALEVARLAGGWLQAARPRWASIDATALGSGFLLALGMAGSTLAWWDPPRWDPLADESRESLSAAVLEPMAWIEKETPPGAVILASPTYAPMVAVAARRRVLRAPTLFKAKDDDRRRRLEHAVLVGTPPPSRDLLARYGLQFVLAAPGDFQDHGVGAPHELAEQPHLRLRHVSGEGFRIYEVVPSAGADAESGVAGSPL